MVDTNVFVSGIFFAGPPYRILKAWRDGRLQPVVSQEVVDEYRRVVEAISKQYPAIDTVPVLEYLADNTIIIVAPSLPEPVCVDPDDDKFIACALAAGCKVIVSGDKHLLKLRAFRRIPILAPRAFLETWTSS